jgi:hypothetical protein
MNINHIFYFIGIVFIFASVIYFVKEFLLNLSPGIKTILLIICVVVFFILGEISREADF